MAPLDNSAEIEALKARHRAIWALGDYPTVAAEIIPDLGAVLIEACSVKQGDRVLDVAAGSGNASIPAARVGARVVACDLTPELLAAGRSEATGLGLSLEWQEGDAEALPFGDGEFDVVVSCLGVMFAPRHQTCADELVRVCRPGGTIGIVSWTPEGFIGEMFKIMAPYSPPPPVGSQPPPLWGSEGHLADILGDRVEALVTQRQSVKVENFGAAEEFRDYFKQRYGPTVAVYRSIASDAERVAALDRDLASLAERHLELGDGKQMEWEYLLATARKRVDAFRRIM